MGMCEAIVRKVRASLRRLVIDSLGEEPFPSKMGTGSRSFRLLIIFVRSMKALGELDQLRSMLTLQ